MGSIGGRSIKDEFGGALGPRTMNNETFGNALVLSGRLRINPKYRSGDSAYRRNCALAATAFALQARGYDVEAMPRDTQWRGFDSVFDVDYSNPDNYVVNSSAVGISGVPNAREIVRKYGADKISIQDVPTMPRGAQAVANKINERMNSWGENSVAILNVKWKDTSGAHTVAVVNRLGGVSIVDPQSGRVEHNITSYLKRTIANHTSLVRVDNAPIKSNIKDLDKIVKRRKS